MGVGRDGVPGVGAGEVDAGATVTGAGATIQVAAGAGEVDAGATSRARASSARSARARPTPSPTCKAWARSSRRPGRCRSFPASAGSVHRRPTFDTIVATHPSGAEVRLALWQNCLWEFELSYDALASNAAYPGAGNQTLQTLMGFYLARGGQRGTFLFIDPDFNAMVGQGIGAGDGTTIVFPFYRVVRRPGGAGQLGDGGRRDLPRRRRAAVGMDGQRQRRSPSPPPPASGVVISADFSYGFICRFLEDTLDFEEFMDNLWQLKSLKFRQVRL